MTQKYILFLMNTHRLTSFVLKGMIKGIYLE